MSYKPREGIMTRDVLMSECDWLPHDLHKGDAVKEFNGCTYGCISYNWIAVNIDNDVFYEIPYDSVEFN